MSENSVVEIAKVSPRENADGTILRSTHNFAAILKDNTHQDKRVLPCLSDVEDLVLTLINAQHKSSSSKLSESASKAPFLMSYTAKCPSPLECDQDRKKTSQIGVQD